MAKKQPLQPDSSLPPAADRHKNTVVSFRPEEALRSLLMQQAQAERRSMAQIIEILLEEALKARGLWPPPAAPQG